VVGSTVVAVIADELEAANHLADGEETKALGSNDTTSDELGAVHVSDTLNYRGRLLSGLGGSLRGGLRKSAGVERLLVEVLPVALESLEGAGHAASIYVIQMTSFWLVLLTEGSSSGCGTRSC
jgi:hypothetical protein